MIIVNDVFMISSQMEVVVVTFAPGVLSGKGVGAVLSGTSSPELATSLSSVCHPLSPFPAPLPSPTPPPPPRSSLLTMNLIHCRRVFCSRRISFANN